MNNLCKLRDIYRLIREYEEYFQQKHDLCLNEGMLLCSLQTGELSSGQISEKLGLTNSNTSKIIRSVEAKNFIKRIPGEKDKRQMYFSLNESGHEKIKKIKSEEDQIQSLLTMIQSNSFK